MCTLYERITALCKEKGVTGSRMCLDLGLSKSTMSDMKSGRKKGLSTTNAQKIADYLGVTVDYLLGQKLVPVFENLGGPATELSQKEKAPTETGERDILDDVDVAFYGDFKELNEDEKETVRDMVRLMRQRKEKRSQ